MKVNGNSKFDVIFMATDCAHCEPSHALTPIVQVVLMKGHNINFLKSECYDLYADKVCLSMTCN